MYRLRTLILVWLSVTVVLHGCEGAQPGSESEGAGISEEVPHGALDLRRTVEGNSLGFGRIEALVADDDGQIYVADGMAQEIMVISPDGELINTMGGPGEGPAEFGRLWSVAWAGDRLIALDLRRQGFASFQRTGEFAESSSADGGLIMTGSGLFSGGDSAYGLTVVREPLSPSSLLEPHYLRFGADGSIHPLPAVRDSVIWPTGMDCMTPDATTIHVFRFPFMDRGPLRAFLPDGELIVAHRNAYVLDVIDVSSGDVVRSISREYPALPLREADWEAQTEMQSFRRVEEEAGGTLVLPSDPGTRCDLGERRPNFWPVLRTVVSDERGRLWVESTAKEADGTYTLTVFDLDGSIVGGAPMPPRDGSVAPYVRDELLYLVTADEFEVQSIEIYEFTAGQ